MKSPQRRPPSTSPINCSVWFGPRVSPAEERDLIAHLVEQRGVGVCCWPRDTARVEHLAAANVPRLLLVDPGSTPPVPAPGQAWLRTTARNTEIHDALVGLCGSARPEVRFSS